MVIVSSLAVIGVALIAVAAWNLVAQMDAADAGGTSGNIFQPNVAIFALLGVIALVSAVVTAVRSLRTSSDRTA